MTLISAFGYSIAMLDLPGLPVLDKARLVGGCLRCQLTIDARDCVRRSNPPAALWQGTGGASACTRWRRPFPARLRAGRGPEAHRGRPPLAQLPYARSIIEELIGAYPLRCLLARLPPGAVIDPHIDKAPYFAKSLRVHMPVVTNAQAWMYCAGLSYKMLPGEVWVLNNSDMHGVWNASTEQARVHMICDFEPSPALLERMARGERHLGVDDPGVRERLAVGARER
jgi:hypothetical protein